MMPALDPLDRELLDFLCSCAHHRVRVIRVKSPRAASLRRLRELGLVGRDDHLPSGSALLDWIERRKTGSEGAMHARATEEPPRAGAAEPTGGGDARKVAPPPQAKRTVSVRQREETPRSVGGAEGTGGGAKPVPDEASPTLSIPSTEGPHPSADPPGFAPAADRGAAVPEEFVQARPALEEPPGRVDLKVNFAPRRDPTQKPDTPLIDLRERQSQHGYRRAAAVRHGQEAEAIALLDKGVEPSTQSSFTANLMRSILRRRLEEARLACPIEQAKTVIRQRGWVCFAAVISGGPLDHFYIGNRLVTEPQLLAFAENLRTTRRARAG